MKNTFADVPPVIPSGHRLLIRSSWQPVNIGDLGHSPGLLAMLERHLPGMPVTLWSNVRDPDDQAALRTRFPDLHIVHGVLGPDGRADTPELREAVARAPFLLHGSGASIVALDDLDAWRRHTGKPYGIYAVTIDPLEGVSGPGGLPSEEATLRDQQDMIDALPRGTLPDRQRTVLENAAFAFARDSLTLRYLRAEQVHAPGLRFAPDAAFGIDVRNEPRAEAFLRRHRLEPGRFLCVIPRLRYTPYHKVYRREPTERDLRRAAVSERFQDADFLVLRELICRWVRHTGLPAVLVPEMTYQVDVGRDMVLRHLPDDVREHVRWSPDYWLPDEACSVYARSAAVLSMDNHSPIFALAMGVPTLFLRQPSDTIKGRMWDDVGMDSWWFEIGEALDRGADRELLALWDNRTTALERVNRIMDRVRRAETEAMQKVRDRIAAAWPRPGQPPDPLLKDALNIVNRPQPEETLP